jgi:hypothetical protein
MTGTFSSSAAAEPVGGDDEDTSPVLDLLQKLLSVEREPHDLSAAPGTSSAAAAEPPEAVGHGDNDDTDEEGDMCPLLDLLHKAGPDLFEKEVLERLDPADRAFLVR